MRAAYREIRPYQILNNLKINSPFMLKILGVCLWGGSLFISK